METLPSRPSSSPMSPFRMRSNSYQTSSGSLQEEVNMLSSSRNGPRINHNTMEVTPSGTSPEKRNSSRTSLLVMASDALNFNFGRRRKSIRHPVLPPRPMPIILPDVIEISAAHKDEEVEERGRLREEAAQALGLAISPGDGTEHGSILDSLGQGPDSQHTSESAEDQELLDDTVSVASTRTPNHQHSHTISSIHSPLTPLASTLSIAIPPVSPRSLTHLGHGRSRSGSMPGGALSSLKTTETRSSSITGPPAIPTFPTTPAALTQFSQLSSTFPKYYPPPSLRIFALSKQWKTRFMVLSTPPNPSFPTLTSSRSVANNPPVSYLHLFKSAVAEEREYERLEINEDSVVFVSEEEVGGRKNVIKVGGIDVGAMRKDLSHEEGGRTMWFLQITDSAEAQKWITNIKSSILNQRAVRAGLGSHSNSPGVGVVEPRGDMDVMLSIRAQSIMTSPTSSPSFERPSSPESQRPYAASVSSVRSQGNGAVVGHSGGAGGVSALKGFFSGAGNRPRSSSRATSVCSDSGQDDGRRESVVSSSGTGANHTKGGNSLMSLLRSNAVDSIHASSSTGSVGNVGSLSAPVSIPSPTQPHLFSHIIDREIHPTEEWNLRHSQLERRIIENPSVFGDDEGAATPVFRQNVLAKRNAVSTSTTRAMKAMSVDAISLQPPPRKRWTAIGSHHPFMTAGVPEIPEDNGKRAQHWQSDNLSTHGREESASSVSGISISPGGMSGFSFGTPEQRPRSPSTGSVSTIASIENGRPGSFSGERASINTKRNSVAKRWSRQLPQRLTPPSGPPPATPTSAHQRSPSGSIVKKSPKPHPYATMERSPSRSSQSSISNGIPSFSKRASASSALSVNTASTSQSQNNSVTSHSRPGSTHRTSLQPPPRPPPSFALPPTPVVDVGTSISHTYTNSLSPTHTSPLKDPVASRISRLSLGAPKPPPSGMLPPRPDESIPQVRRRAGSSGAVSLRSLTSTLNSNVLYSIPASPVSTFSPLRTNSTVLSPPPVGPLPPTPPSTLTRILTTAPQPPTSNPSPSRAASIKQRFRILSAPAASPYISTSTTVLNNLASSSRPQPTTNITPTHSPNGTPQTEKASFVQNNGDSVIALGSPITPSFPTPKIHSIPPPEPEPKITSLSPPPRRGSKRVSLPDTSEHVSDTHLEDPPSLSTTDVDDQQILPSHSSVIVM